MSLLVVGLSHQHAPVSLLERASIDAAALPSVLQAILASDSVNEAMLLSTCNRVEVYADIERFHGGIDAVVGWFANHLQMQATELVDVFEIKYGERVVEHAMRVASGLDSMVVGEPQILGQLRTAYLDAVDHAAVSTQIHALAQRALRVGKRVQTELQISTFGRNMATVAVDLAAELTRLPGASALVAGAGSMAALAAHALRRNEIGSLLIANRSQARAQLLAERVDGQPISLADVPAHLGDADVLITALGSSPALIDRASLAGRDQRPLTIIDLALPKNVADEVTELPYVRYIGLTQIQDRARQLSLPVDDGAALELIADEVAQFIAKQNSAAVAPTITALRAKADGVVERELSRLKNRIPDVDDRALGEIEYAISRIVDKIMHTPTVRVREVAGTPSGEAYAEALRTLFDLSVDNLQAAISIPLTTTATVGPGRTPNAEAT